MHSQHLLTTDRRLLMAVLPAHRGPAAPRSISCSRLACRAASDYRSPDTPPPPAAEAAAAAAAAASAGSRRDVLISTLLATTAAAVDQARADGDQPGPAAEAVAAAEGEAAAPAAGDSSSSSKQGKQRRKPVRRRQQAAAPKPPGVIPRVKLAEGLEVSQIIRGCWQLDGQHRGDPLSNRTTGAAAIQDLDEFCRHGIFTLDTADNYGPSEALIGQHLRLNPGAAARTKVLTKLSFMTPPSAAELRKENIEYRVRSSIARLGITTLDLVQLHWEPPVQQQPQPARSHSSSSSNQAGFVTAARALQQLQAEGLVRAVGVTNFDVPMLMALQDAGIKPASNQVSFSVLDRRPALFLSRFCEARGIPLLCYGTLAGGLLAERYRDVPASMVRIDTSSKARYGGLLRQLGGWSLMQDVLTALHEVAARHGVSASCVAARWVLQQRGVAALVLGARNASHLRDSQRIFSFELDEIDILDIDAAYEGAAQPTSDVYVWERGGDW